MERRYISAYMMLFRAMSLRLTPNMKKENGEGNFHSFVASSHWLLALLVASPGPGGMLESWPRQA